MTELNSSKNPSFASLQASLLELPVPLLWVGLVALEACHTAIVLRLSFWVILGNAFTSSLCYKPCFRTSLLLSLGWYPIFRVTHIQEYPEKDAWNLKFLRTFRCKNAFILSLWLAVNLTGYRILFCWTPLSLAFHIVFRSLILLQFQPFICNLFPPLSGGFLEIFFFFYLLCSNTFRIICLVLVLIFVLQHPFFSVIHLAFSLELNSYSLGNIFRISL